MREGPEKTPREVTHNESIIRPHAPQRIQNPCRPFPPSCLSTRLHIETAVAPAAHVRYLECASCSRLRFIAAPALHSATAALRLFDFAASSAL